MLDLSVACGINKGAKGMETATGKGSFAAQSSTLGLMEIPRLGSQCKQAYVVYQKFEIIHPKGAWRFVTTPSMAVIAVFVKVLSFSCRWNCLCLLSFLLSLLLLLLLLFCGCGCDASHCCDGRGRHSCLGRRRGRGRVVVVVVGGGGSGYHCRFLSSSSSCGCNQRLFLDRFCSHWLLLQCCFILFVFLSFCSSFFLFACWLVVPPTRRWARLFRNVGKLCDLHFWILLLIPIDNATIFAERWRWCKPHNRSLNCRS